MVKAKNLFVKVQSLNSISERDTRQTKNWRYYIIKLLNVHNKLELFHFWGKACEWWTQNQVVTLPIMCYIHMFFFFYPIKGFSTTLSSRNIISNLRERNLEFGVLSIVKYECFDEMKIHLYL